MLASKCYTLILNVIVLLLERVDVGLVVGVAVTDELDVVAGRVEYLSARGLLAANVGYGIAERVKAVLDVVAPLALESVVVRSLAVGLGHGAAGAQVLVLLLLVEAGEVLVVLLVHRVAAQIERVVEAVAVAVTTVAVGVVAGHTDIRHRCRMHRRRQLALVVVVAQVMAAVHVEAHRVGAGAHVDLVVGAALVHAVQIVEANMARVCIDHALMVLMMLLMMNHAFTAAATHLTCRFLRRFESHSRRCL